MPLIRIEFDDAKVSTKEVGALSKSVRDIVSSITAIDDVFVYANTAQIKFQIAPIEIFVQMTAKKITDEDALVAQIKEKLSNWKKEVGFGHPINLTLMPMNWKVEIAI